VITPPPPERVQLHVPALAERESFILLRQGCGGQGSKALRLRALLSGEAAL